MYTITFKFADEIDILYNDEVDHELERENLLKEKDKLISSIERFIKLSYMVLFTKLYS